MLKAPCRLCGSTVIADAVVFHGVPRSNHRLLREDELIKDIPTDLPICQCLSCHFIFSGVMFDESSYEDDYLMVRAFSQQTREFQRSQALEFVNRFNLRGGKILEIGCGEGSYLSYLFEAGTLPQGIEPSKALGKIAHERNGFLVESGLMTVERNVVGAPFDGFVTRQVLEHIPDIKGFLFGIRRNLKPGAYGLVEVPSLEKIIEELRFYEFIPEHINYFSKQSLRLALELGGFEILEIRSETAGENLLAYVRAPIVDSPGLAEICAHSKTLSDRLIEFIQQEQERGHSVAIWGAGGKGLTILAAARIFSIDLLVDGDLHKLGLFTPVSHLKVESTDQISERKIDTVVVSAPAYRHEIVRMLREHLGFKGTIAVLAADLEVLH